MCRGGLMSKLVRSDNQENTPFLLSPPTEIKVLRFCQVNDYNLNMERVDYASILTEFRRHFL